MIHKKLLLIALSTVLFISCNDFQPAVKKEIINKGFVYLEDNAFKIRDSTFFPLMINYITCIRKIDDQFTISPDFQYDLLDRFEGNTVDSVQNTIRGHFQLLKEIGFNSIRLVGIGEFNFNDETGDLYFSVRDSLNNASSLNLRENNEVLFTCYEQFFEIAREFGFKVMVLLHRPYYNKIVYANQVEHYKSMLSRFKDDTTIVAYDFFNEPLYFDKSLLPNRDRTKKEAYKLVRSWRKIMDKFAPNQLMTIGFSEPLEVFEWDPSIMPVDFLSFHTYHPLRVPNEIYWYANYINKPWMIGETSLPSDNIAITYLEQKQFMKEVYQRVVNCGGAGLGWWHFQDVQWNTSFEHDFTALLNHEGVTYTQDGKYKIYGTPKLAAKGVANFKNYTPTHDCKKAENYYNMVGYKNIVLKGKIIDSRKNQPIEGAVIRGWNKGWLVGANTFTNENGEFNLYSNDKFIYFEISAPGMTKIKFGNDTIEYKQAYPHNFTMDSLPDQELEYHDISYFPFLVEPDLLADSSLNLDHVLFNFDPRLFNQAKFEGNLGVLELKKLKFID